MLGASSMSLSADFNNERDLLKSEGEDLQSLCAECDDVWE